jgi:ABC-type Zn uptake system ZnuABC Zn-binding protein ZnuA
VGVVALITRAARVVALAAALGLAAPAQAQLRVVAATTDVAAIAAAVGGDLITVDTIVPPAVDPEAFEPRPGDLEKIRNAQLLVRVGLGYDYWLDKLVRQTGDQRLMRGGEAYVDASVGIPLLEVSGQSVINEGGHAHGVANPHYWLDPENAKIVSAGIADALARLLPNERARIAANRERFVADLDRAIARWTAQLTPVAGAKLIAYHNSWPYFARREPGAAGAADRGRQKVRRARGRTRALRARGRLAFRGTKARYPLRAARDFGRQRARGERLLRPVRP